MSGKKMLRTWLSVVLFLSFFHVVSAQIQWETNPRQALQKARQTNKQLLIYFFTEKARDCKKYEQQTFKNPRVVEFLNENYVCMTAHAARNRNIASYFGVIKVPAILIIDHNGHEYLRIITYYPPDKFVQSLSQSVNYARGDSATPKKPSKSVKAQNALYYQPFENLSGWGNEGSTEGAMAQIGLVPGVQGNAFRIDYELVLGEFNYVQVHTNVGGIPLPQKFNLSFHVAGTGGRNKLDIKFADNDGTNYGCSIMIPTDNKPHKYTMTSEDIGYLWGGEDKVLNNLSVFHIAVTSENYNNPDSSQSKGVVYIDELVVTPAN